MTTQYINSVCLAAPVAYVAAINQFGAALGYGDESLSRPLSADGQEPATHYGGHTWATNGFLATIANGLSGKLPRELEGQDPAQVQAVLGQLQTLVNTEGTPFDHWTTFLSGLGLQVIEPSDES